MKHAIVTAILVFPLLFLFNECAAIHTVPHYDVPSKRSRNLQNSVLVRDDVLIKDYRDDKWTTTSSATLFSALSKSNNNMGKGSSSDSSLVPSVSRMPSPSPKKGKGMKRMSKKRPKDKDCRSSKMGRMSKGRGMRMGKGKRCTPTIAPTVTVFPTITPTISSTTTIAPTTTTTTTTMPTAPSQMTVSPTRSPKATPVAPAPIVAPTPVVAAPVPITAPLPSPNINAPTLAPQMTSNPTTSPKATTTTAPVLSPSSITVAPTIAPFVTSIPPSPSSSTIVPTRLGTMAPTSDSVRATPFRLTYVLTDSTPPNDAQYMVAADVALMNIERYVREQFSGAFGIEIDTFDGTMTATGINPIISMDFEVVILFTADRSFLPSTSEVDALIAMALMSPNVDTLIAEYNALSPTDTPFATTQSVTYQTV